MVPFGYRNASAYFTRVLQCEISKAGLDHCCISFIDDICVHSRTAEEHIQQVGQVLDMLYNCGLRAHPDKSVFGAAVVSYRRTCSVLVGHAVSETGMSPQEAKIQSVKDMKPPLNQAELRTVLGFLSYYRC